MRDLSALCVMLFFLALVKLGKLFQVFCALSPKTVQLLPCKSPPPVSSRLTGGVHSAIAAQAEKILHRHNEQTGWRPVAGANHVPGHGVTPYPQITPEEILYRFRLFVEPAPGGVVIVGAWI